MLYCILKQYGNTYQKILSVYKEDFPCKECRDSGSILRERERKKKDNNARQYYFTLR